MYLTVRFSLSCHLPAVPTVSDARWRFRRDGDSRNLHHKFCTPRAAPWVSAGRIRHQNKHTEPGE
jgi:hypothetical protein